MERLTEDVDGMKNVGRVRTGYRSAYCVSKWRKGEIEKGECNRRRRKHERMLSEKRQRGKARYEEEVEKAVKEGGNGK